jgi:flavin reductase (DIM6/NTAB) family NADH-FMN oxidoreductase RutF
MAKLVKAPRTALNPAPAVLVTAGTMETSDVTTLAWVGTLCSEPPTIGIGVRPTRWLHHLIVEGGAFVVNVADVAHVRQLDLCGMVSGRDTDKWALAGLTREAGTATAVPLVAECPLNIECVVRQTLHLGSHDLFIGEVVAVHVDERIQPAGRIDGAAFDPVCYVAGQYWQLGKLVASFGFSQKHGDVND